MTTPNETPAVEVEAAAPNPAVEEKVEGTPDQVVEGQGEQQEQEEQPRASGEPFQLEVPGDVPMRLVSDQVTETVTSFSGAAHQAGLSREIAQEMVDSFVDAASVLGVDSRFEGDAEDTESTLRSLWGNNYDATIKTVRANVRSLGENFAQYLEDSNLGNDPRALLALANLADYKLSAKAAQQELDRLMTTPDYSSPDKQKRALVLARVQVLSRVANRGSESPETRLNTIVKPKEVSPGTANFIADRVAKVTTASEARATVGKMMQDKRGPLMNSGHRDHAAAVKEYLALLAKI